MVAQLRDEKLDLYPVPILVNWYFYCLCLACLQNTFRQFLLFSSGGGAMQKTHNRDEYYTEALQLVSLFFTRYFGKNENSKLLLNN